MAKGSVEMRDGGEDRFGVDPALIGQVFKRHLEAGVIRFGCYVPTRNEVATKPLDWVANVVSDWFWESPEELAPEEEQVAAVIRILLERVDADDPRIKALIEDTPSFDGP
jgi:hypothetical protein